MTTFNPGEPVFDQSTGEPVIDNVTGDFVEVVPSGVFTDLLSKRSYDADDVANAVYFRVNTFRGEVKRRRDLGVDYYNLVFGPVGIDVAVGEVANAIRQTPGVQAVTGVRAVSQNPSTRSLGLEYRVVKTSGQVAGKTVQVRG